MLALLRIDRRQPLNHQDHAIHEWRTKASGQLLRDLSRFATVDARGSFQMALCVKGKWKKREDGGQDYSSQPESAHMDEIYNVTQNRNVKEIRIPR